MSIKKPNILLIVGNLSTPGGVSVFWNSILESLKKIDEFHFNILEIGGHGKNILGVFFDQWRVHQNISSNQNKELAIINPSLLNRSFFRDGLFAKQLQHKNVPFMVFFHGWDVDFEAKVTQKYTNFFLKSFGKAEKIFVLSQDFKEKIIEWGYEGEVIVITTTVDINLVKNFSLETKIEHQKKSTTHKILFLSRMVKAKGVFELIEAFKKVNQKIKNSELILAGDGEAFQEVASLVANIENIRLTGYVEGDEKIALLEESDVYILPSYSEGLPISVLEAMLFGLPIITTRVGGLKNFFKNKKMGYFIEPKDRYQIEESLFSILSNKDKTIEISKYNHQYAKKYLTNDVVGEIVSKHLKELL